MADSFAGQEDFFRQVWDFPLGEALTGRRARRFAMGMEVPGGPLAFKSQQEPLPLSETEQAILICAATGVTGWHFGVPYSTSSPQCLPQLYAAVQRAHLPYKSRQLGAVLHR